MTGLTWVAFGIVLNTEMLPRLSQPGPSNLISPQGPQSDKVKAALDFTDRMEGGCQALRSDRGNYFQGSIGHTCMGLIPANGWAAKDKELGWVKGFTGHPASFVKYAHDQDSARFKRSVQEIFVATFFSPCKDLPDPAYTICADIGVNSGPGQSRKYLALLPSNLDAKTLATKLNELHRADYIAWSSSGPNVAHRTGWLNRAKEREEYIRKF